MLDIGARNEIDLGERIGKFFKSIETFTACDWKKILCYLEDKENAYGIANDVMDKNIKHAKELMKYIDSFYKSHRRIFRRYKHAGFPIRYAGQPNLSRIFPLKFDFSTGVYIGKDLLRDIVYLPYSDDIIQSYKILLPSLQVFIKDTIISRLGCIQRGVFVLKHKGLKL